MTISEFEFDRPTSAIQAIERATSILRLVGVDPHQIALWLLSQYSKFDPAHANIYEDASEVVEWRITKPQPPDDLTQTPATVALTTLTATQVGQMLTERYPDIVYPPSAQQINQALQRLDFHSRNEKKWQLTKLGQQYGRIINVTDEQDRTRLQVRWLPTVLEQLAPLFSVIC